MNMHKGAVFGEADWVDTWWEAGHAAGQEVMLVVCIETSKATFLSGSNLSQAI